MRGRRIVVAVAVTGALIGGAVAARVLTRPAAVVEALRPEAEPPAWADDYDLKAEPPEQVAPGTVVGDGPPAGWSHLIIKSLPRVKASEVDRLPDPRVIGGRQGLVKRASWMFTVFTARVVEERQGAHTRHRLDAVGLGLGANVDGRDTVLGAGDANLKWDEALILGAGYDVQKQSRVVVHGPTFALVDTPVAFRCGERNRNIRFRYGLLVDPATGRLDVFAWRLGAEDGECSDLTRAVLLNPNTIDRAELLPDPSAFNSLGIPSDRAFGVDSLPPHRLEVTIPAEVRAAAGKTRFAPEEARSLEDALRKLLPR